MGIERALCTVIVSLAVASVSPAPSWAQEPERQLVSLDLENESHRARLRLISSSPVEWQISTASDGSPVLSLPNSSPGREVRSRRYQEGLVAAVEVALEGRGRGQTTVVTIRVRHRVEPLISQSREILTVDLIPETQASPGAEAPRAA